MGITHSTSRWSRFSRFSRSVLKLSSAMVLLAALVMGSVGVTHAAPTPTGAAYDTISPDLSHSYDLYWDFPTAKLGVCIRYRVTGTFTYNVSTTGGGGKEIEWRWTNITLNAPRLSAYVWSYYSGCGSSSEYTSQLEMTQYWTGFACDFNPSLSFSAPWGMGFSFWPNCGTRYLAQDWTPFYNDRNTQYNQYNTGNSGYFGEYDTYTLLYQSPTPPCYGVYVSSQAWEGGNADNFRSQSAQQVCLPA